jgi:hypothetical protein
MFGEDVDGKYVDELRIHLEKEFMIVKGKSHVIGERLKQKVILSKGNSVCFGLHAVRFFYKKKFDF